MTADLGPRRAAAARLALLRDERGATVIEFAIIAPVMGLLLLGGFDVAHSLYMRSVLQGVVQKTARDSTLEGGGTPEAEAALDQKVTAQVKAIANNGEITIRRRYYRTFSDVAAARAETWTDLNKNNICDDGEPYEDANLNSNWDRDGGNQGQGGAKDAVLYSVQVEYPRFFPLYNFIGGSKTTKITGTTVLRNQPFADQGSYGAMKVRNCP
jgi:Flp pilus assembly protein TadG